MNNQHTPGPWTYRPAKADCDELKVEKCMTISAKNWMTFALVATRIDGDESDLVEGIANLRLMTAAPDLLAVCQIAKQYLESRKFKPSGPGEFTMNFVEIDRLHCLLETMLQAAIAKATQV